MSSGRCFDGSGQNKKGRPKLDGPERVLRAFQCAGDAVFNIRPRHDLSWDGLVSPVSSLGRNGHPTGVLCAHQRATLRSSRSVDRPPLCDWRRDLPDRHNACGRPSQLRAIDVLRADNGGRRRRIGREAAIRIRGTVGNAAAAGTTRRTHTAAADSTATGAAPAISARRTSRRARRWAGLITAVHRTVAATKRTPAAAEEGLTLLRDGREAGDRDAGHSQQFGNTHSIALLVVDLQICWTGFAPQTGSLRSTLQSILARCFGVCRAENLETARGFPRFSSAIPTILTGGAKQAI